MLLDPNPYSLKKDKMNKDATTKEQRNFKIYIHTLAQSTAYGPGSYAMSSLKKMTGTKSFLQLPEKQNCNQDLF